jgi:hypothetical protein
VNWAWAVPTAIAGIGIVAMMVVAHRTGEEARALRRDLEGLTGLRPALLEVRDEMEATAEAVRRLRRG